MPRIDYAVRPAKNVERKMIAESLAHLARLEHLEKFRYVGFGALYFRDFSLFHRVLGISDMFSIEHNIAEDERYDFNRPFACVKMQYGQSSVELPKISLDDMKSIVWLDYEKHLTKDMLHDVSYVCGNALPGSVLIVTVNAQSGLGRTEEEDEEEENVEEVDPVSRKERVLNPSRLDWLKTQLPGKIPPETKKSDLSGWGTAALFRTVIENEIAETLNARNGILPPEEQVLYRRLFNFHYADDAKMLTVGGLLYSQPQLKSVDDCGFADLPFCNPTNHPYFIPAPRLTYRERRHLNLHLPVDDVRTIDRKGIPEQDVNDYSKVYRYFPNFSEIDI